MTDTTDSASLYARTLQLARSAPRSIKQKHMAKACNLSESWISELLNEKMAHPSVHHVQCLHDYLVSVGA